MTAAATQIIANLPLTVSANTWNNVVSVAYYPLALFSKNNEYAAGVTLLAANRCVQGGRVLSNIGSSVTIYAAATSIPISIGITPYQTTYYPQGTSDVVSQTIYDPSVFTYSGENPVSSFVSGILTDANSISSYISNLSSSSSSGLDAIGGAVGGLTSSIQGLASSASSALQNIVCKMDTLTNMITQLNGITDSITGAVIGGISNAISSINSIIPDYVSKLQGLITSVGAMGSIGLKVNCKCMAFDLSVNLSTLLAPIASWLTGFANMLSGLFPKIPNPFAG